MYLDANFFIFAKISPGSQGVASRKLLKSIEEHGKAITSVLTIDEVMWVMRRNGRASEIRDLLEEIYGTRNLDVKEVPAHIPLRALDFMEEHKLKPRDAFHVAIMEHFGEREIVSDDRDFDKVPSMKRIKI